MSDLKTSAAERKNQQKLNLEEFNNEIALAVLIGSWDKNNLRDKKIISQIVNKDYEDWISILNENEILESHSIFAHFEDEQYETILQERKKLWNSLNVKPSDIYLESFKKAAISVLRESSYLMDVQKSYDVDLDNAHKIKSLSYSTKLREGLAGGLALLGSSQSLHTSSEKNISSLAVHKIFKDANEKIWKTLARFLPTLAEAAPKEFLNAVERTFKQSPSLYKKILSQQNDSTTDYLLWALEALAWDEKHLNQVCLILGYITDDQECIRLGQLIDDALESLLWEESLPPIQIKTAPNKLSFKISKLKLMDFKKNHQPINVLRNIFCPWNLQTKASYETCQAVLANLKNERPEVAWHLLVSLFPSWRNSYTEDTHQPVFQPVLIHSKREFLQDDYLQQTQACFDLAVSMAGHDILKLSHLTRTLYYFYPKSLIIERSPLSQVDKNRQDSDGPVNNLLIEKAISSASKVDETNVDSIESRSKKDNLQVTTVSKQDIIDELAFTKPFPLLTKFLDHLVLKEISEKTEDQRFELWTCLNKLVLLHRCSGRQWVFDDMTILKIENITKKLAPKNPLLINQRWFSDMATTHLMYQTWFPHNKKYNEEGKRKLNQIRREAMKEIVYEGEVEAIIQFAKAVNHPEVGACVASTTCNPEFDRILIPRILDNFVTEDQSVTKCLTSFLIGYVKQRQKDHDLSHSSSSLSWVDQLDRSKWNSTQVGQFSQIMQQVFSELQSSKLWDKVSDGTADPDEVKKEMERMIMSNQVFYHLPYITQLLEQSQNSKTNYFSIKSINKLLRASLLSKELSHDQEATGHLLHFVQVLYKNSQQANNPARTNINDLFTEDPELFCRVIHLPYLTYTDNHSHSYIEQICQLLLHKWTTPPQNLRNWVESVKSFCIEQKHLKNTLKYIGEMLAKSSVKKGTFIAFDLTSEWIEILNSEKEIRQGFIDTLSKKAEAVQRDVFGQFINGIQRVSQKWKEGGYAALSYDLDQFVTKLHLSSQVVERLANQIHHFVFEKTSGGLVEKQVSQEDFRSFCEEIKSEINHLIQQKVKS